MFRAAFGVGQLAQWFLAYQASLELFSTHIAQRLWLGRKVLVREREGNGAGVVLTARGLGPMLLLRVKSRPSDEQGMEETSVLKAKY